MKSRRDLKRMTLTKAYTRSAQERYLSPLVVLLRVDAASKRRMSGLRLGYTVKGLNANPQRSCDARCTGLSRQHCVNGLKYLQILEPSQTQNDSGNIIPLKLRVGERDYSGLNVPYIVG